jgi:hypothetical protein
VNEVENKDEPLVKDGVDKLEEDDQEFRSEERAERFRGERICPQLSDE